MISFFLEQFTSPLYLWLSYHRIPLNGAPILPAEGNACSITLYASWTNRKPNLLGTSKDSYHTLLPKSTKISTYSQENSLMKGSN